MIKSIHSYLTIFMLIAVFSKAIANENEFKCTPQITCEDLINQAKKHGPMILIVSLNVPSLNDLDINSQTSTKEKQEIESQHLAKISEIKKRVLARINANAAHIKLRQTYEGLSGISVQADATGISLLLDDPDVLQLNMNTTTFISLAQSIPLVGAPIMWDQDFTGDGYAIAILDTGVDKNHPFLLDKVVAEACFSSTAAGEHPIYGPWTTTSLCPDSTFKKKIFLQAKDSLVKI